MAGKAGNLYGVGVPAGWNWIQICYSRNERTSNEQITNDQTNNSWWMNEQKNNEQTNDEWWQSQRDDGNDKKNVDDNYDK